MRQLRVFNDSRTKEKGPWSAANTNENASTNTNTCGKEMEALFLSCSLSSAHLTYCSSPSDLWVTRANTQRSCSCHETIVSCADQGRLSCVACPRIRCMPLHSLVQRDTYAYVSRICVIPFIHNGKTELTRMGNSNGFTRLLSCARLLASAQSSRSLVIGKKLRAAHGSTRTWLH